MSADGALATNIVHFGRAARAAGLRVGSAEILTAIAAAQTGCLRGRDDFYWALHGVFVRRPEDRAVFAELFRQFWRDPQVLERMMQMLLPQAPGAPPPPPPAAARRAMEAMLPKDDKQEQREEEEEFDAALTFSADEKLRHQDFETMSADEMAAARRAMARLQLQLREYPVRRLRPARHGRRVDLRRTMRSALRTAAEPVSLKLREPTTREPPLVALCDISGSMSRYSRMLLHFLYGLIASRERVHAFVFGTRLTNVTRLLRHRDVDIALGQVGAQVEDWAGGTRIGATLAEFNRRWSRRVLGQGAVVLLITDGLDRDGGEDLAFQAARLRRSCRRLVWLNPLLRWDGYEAKARGAAALLPQVDEFRPVHNLASLEDLAAALSGPVPARRP